MNKLSSLTALLLLSGTCIEGFVAPQQVRSLQPSTLLQAKGFGSKETPSSKATSGAKSINEEPVSSPMTTSPAPVADEPDLSQGKAALEKMRRERAELRNAELRKVKEVQDVDALLRETPEAAAIPERVAQRMGKRMLPFVGIPIFGSGGAFVGFWYMATYRDMEYQPALVAATSIALLLSGLLVRVVYNIQVLPMAFLARTQVSRPYHSLSHILTPVCVRVLRIRS